MSSDPVDSVDIINNQFQMKVSSHSYFTTLHNHMIILNYMARSRSRRFSSRVHICKVNIKIKNVDFMLVKLYIAIAMHIESLNVKWSRLHSSQTEDWELNENNN